MSVLLFCFLIFLGQGARYSDISEKHLTSFTGDDSLTSAQGTYRVTLIVSNCTLAISKFDETTNQYIFKSQYIPRSTIQACPSLSPRGGKIIASNGRVFAQFRDGRDYTEASLTIDELGKLRMIGLVSDATSPTWAEAPLSQPLEISLNKLVFLQKEIDSTLNLDLINGGKWSFQVANGQVTLKKDNYLFREPLQAILINPFGIYDLQGRTQPFIDARFTPLEAPCKQVSQKFTISAPFTLLVDNMLPRLTVIDNNGYTILRFSPQLGSFCPTGLLEHKGDCVVSCPAPYIANIRPKKSLCSLVCQYGAIISSDGLYCTCPNDLSLSFFNSARIYDQPPNTKIDALDFSCSSSGFFYDSLYRTGCQSQCPDRSFAIQGRCVKCPENCLKCERDNSLLYYLKCTSCESPFTVSSKTGLCVAPSSCTSNCRLCQGNVCKQCQPLYVLTREQCQFRCPKNQNVVEQSSFRYVCEATATVRCAEGCIDCYSDAVCKACASGYWMMVTPAGVSCRKTNPFFSCDSTYYSYFPSVETCVVQDDSFAELKQCLPEKSNCRFCYSRSNSALGDCIVCNEGFVLVFADKNQCRSTCPANTFTVKGRCIAKPANCKTAGFLEKFQPITLTTETVFNSDSYALYTLSRKEPANHPHGYTLHASAIYGLLNRTAVRLNSELTSTTKVCLLCQTSFGLSADQKSCLPCPTSCPSTCVYAAVCPTETKQAVTGPLSPTDLLCSSSVFRLPEGGCVAGCNFGFSAKISVKFPGKLQCVDASVAPSNPNVTLNDLQVSLSAYPDHNGTNTVLLVFSSVVSSPQPASSRLLTSSDPLILTQTVSSNSQLVRLSSSLLLLGDSQSMKFEKVKNGPFAVQFINATSIVGKDGSLLPQSTFGLQVGNATPKIMETSNVWIGRVISMILVLVHIVYIGSSMTYKVDNLLIFSQSIYHFLFVNNLYGNYLAAYLNGWGWINGTFFPNFFVDLLSSIQQKAPAGYKITVFDSSFLRNAGPTLSFLFVAIGIWLLVLIVNKLMELITGNLLFQRQVPIEGACAIIQFFSLNLIYWACVNLNWGSSDAPNEVAASAVVIALFVIYTAIRGYFNVYAIPYMIKRLILAPCLMACTTGQGFVGLLIGIEVLFIIGRVSFEEFSKLSGTFERGFIIFEGLVFAVGYIILTLFTDILPVALYTGIGVVLLLAFLIVDLRRLYLNTWNLSPIGLTSLNNDSMTKLPTSDRLPIVTGHSLPQMESNTHIPRTTTDLIESDRDLKYRSPGGD